MSKRVCVAIITLTVFVSGFTLQSRRQREEAALAEPFKGVTLNGTAIPGLYAIQSTGVSTEPIREAAEQFLASLDAELSKKTRYSTDDIEWRKWHNVHRAPREGVSFGEMNDTQRERAFALLGASLSAKGLKKTKNVMQLNEHIAEIVGKHGEYGEEFYWITMMGEPSKAEPWGWQLDGHHLVINYFVLGDQVVMTPAFMGSEPVIGTGRFAGVEVMQDEQNKGLAFMESLDASQQKQAMLAGEKTRGDALAQAYNDNLVLDYAGLRVDALSAPQKRFFREVVAEYVFNMDEGHGALRMKEIEAHLDETYFAWLGTTGPESVFYYRIQSPVILIEFDHQGPIALDGPRVPSRRHVHSMVRTPNGNDYGKDLLRQHYEQRRTDAAHGHVH